MGTDLGNLSGHSPSKLIESIPAIFYVAELGEFGKWSYVSPQVEEILGYSPDEWIEDPRLWSDSLHPDDRDTVLPMEDAALVDLDRPLPVQYRLRRKDGEYIWVAQRSRLVRGENGALVWRGMIATSIPEGSAAETRRYSKQCKLLARLARQAADGQNIDDITKDTIKRLVDSEPIDSAVVWLRSDGVLEPIGHDSNGSGQIDPESALGARLATEDVVLVDDWTDQESVNSDRIPAGVRSSVFAQIGGSPGGLGLIAVHSEKPHTFGEHDAIFVEAVANLLGTAARRLRSQDGPLHDHQSDPLTNLPNRQLFRSLLSDAVSDAAENGEGIGVLFLGIDHLRMINDSLGHDVGDQLLRQIGLKLSDRMRSTDAVARFGDEEFAVMLGEIRSSQQAWRIAERIVQQISGPTEVGGGTQFVRVSVGITTCLPGDQGSRGADDLIGEADAAMHQARESPRETIQVYGHRIREKLARRLQIERDLYRAVAEREFSLVYQPIMDLTTDRVVAFESLIRWEHPEEGTIAPLQFIGIAEEIGLMREIDEWVLGEATRQSGQWLRELGVTVPLAVNLSCKDFARPELPGLVGEQLTKNALPPGSLAIEMTESILLEPTHRATRNMSDLRDMGVQMSLDDFGTGFSSLSYLSEFPFDIIKIDRNFITGLDQPGGRKNALVDAIVGIGKSLSMEIVAEGVSSPTQLREVRRAGCHAAQGFLISYPLSPTDAADLIQRDEPLKVD